MIKAEDILNATHGGLDIILDCYPQAKDCVNAKVTIYDNTPNIG